MTLQRKMGRFSISIRMIESDPEKVKKVMGKCVIFRAEMLYRSMSVEYEASCDDFEIIPMGCIMPDYDVFWDVHGNVAFVKREF